MGEFDILQVVDIMYRCLSEVKTGENTLYGTDSVKFISAGSTSFVWHNSLYQGKCGCLPCRYGKENCDLTGKPPESMLSTM
ncbi:hypothetical protein EZS27_029374 [termite gut metagenome]|uniref:Uncharacterized protein n=1 Tax=termite gut metagenome TaxID=433724 RepID=A0A5J4QK31_9ZZZZ